MLPELRREFTHKSEHLATMVNARHTPDTPVFTIMRLDQPVAIIGGYFEYPGVMQVYALTTDMVKRWPISFHKEVRRIIDGYFSNCKLRRMSMDVRADFIEAQRWAEGLGFERESVKRNYGYDCTDYYVYARLQ